MSKQSFIEKPLGAGCESIGIFFGSERNSGFYKDFSYSRKGKGGVASFLIPSLFSENFLPADQSICKDLIIHSLSSDNQGLVNWLHTEA